MKTIIHVNQFAIRKNKKTGSDDPVLSVKTYKENRYAHEVEIQGSSRLVYRPDKPLSCGARCWIETLSSVKIIRRDKKEKTLSNPVKRRRNENCPNRCRKTLI